MVLNKTHEPSQELSKFLMLFQELQSATQDSPKGLCRGSSREICMQHFPLVSGYNAIDLGQYGDHDGIRVRIEIEGYRSILIAGKTEKSRYIPRIELASTAYRRLIALSVRRKTAHPLNKVLLDFK